MTGKTIPTGGNPMAAKIVSPDEEIWPVIHDFLTACAEGAIVLAPAARRQLQECVGRDPCELGIIEYDFGGEPDLMLDVVHDLDGKHFSLDAIREALDGE